MNLARRDRTWREIRPLMIDHNYTYRLGGTQCVVCWGWADDPKHIGVSAPLKPAPYVTQGPYVSVRKQGWHPVGRNQHSW